MTEDNKNIEERLSEMEDKINMVIHQLNSIMNTLSSNNPEMKQMLNLLQVVTNTLQISKVPYSLTKRTISLKDRILQKHPDIKLDDISNAIISCLERKERLNLSQLTSEVRKERGKASRRIIRERVNSLIKLGIVEELEEGYGRQLRLIPHNNS